MKEKVIFIRVSEDYHQMLKLFACKRGSDMHKEVKAALDEYITRKEKETPYVRTNH